MNYICYVCGYEGLDDDPKNQNFNICPCCGVEFGYGDHGPDNHERHAELRKRWVDRGCKWWSKCREIPNGWDAKRQIEKFSEKSS